MMSCPKGMVNWREEGCRSPGARSAKAQKAQIGQHCPEGVIWCLDFGSPRAACPGPPSLSLCKSSLLQSRTMVARSSAHALRAGPSRAYAGLALAQSPPQPYFAPICSPLPAALRPPKCPKPVKLGWGLRGGHRIRLQQPILAPLTAQVESSQVSSASEKECERISS